METRAHHVVIGSLTLALIAAVLGFVTLDNLRRVIALAMLEDSAPAQLMSLFFEHR
jgi:hypothetical protein